MIQVYLKDDQNDLKYIYDTHKDYDIKSYEYETTSIMSILKMMSTSSLIGQNKLFLINGSKFLVNKTDKLKKKEEEVFLDLINLNTNNKVIFLIEKPLNKTIPYVKVNMDKIEYKENIKSQKEKDFLKKENINISKENLKYLQDNIQEGYNYQSELIKLSIFRDGKEILKEDIDKHIKFKNSLNIFNFVEFILLKKKEEALKYYKKIIYEEDMQHVQILAVMYSQMKFYINLKIFIEQGFVESQIISKLKTSPYRVRASKNVVSKITLEDLIDVNSKIAYYDYLIKSGKTKEENVIINFLISEV